MKPLFEHYAPYAENDDLPLADEHAPITSPADIWPHVTLEFVAVTRHGGKLTAELGYRVAWDEEHTLGAILSDGVLVELCGRVLAP